MGSLSLSLSLSLALRRGGSTTEGTPQAAGAVPPPPTGHGYRDWRPCHGRLNPLSWAKLASVAPSNVRTAAMSTRCDAGSANTTVFPLAMTMTTLARSLPGRCSFADLLRREGPDVALYLNSHIVVAK